MAISAAISKFFGDIKTIFTGRNLIWQGIAIALTYFLVTSGIDAWVVEAMRNSSLRSIVRAGQAGAVGFWLPFVLPLAFIAVGLAWKHKQTLKAGLLIIQAEITGSLLAMFYKSLTGRPGPRGAGLLVEPGTDISEIFRFGFLRGGVFWGWPSSHITVAVSAAVLIAVLYWQQPIIRYLAFAYAAYMAISVSVTFHWLSDGVAGVIFGSIIGYTIAKSALHQRTST